MQVQQPPVPLVLGMELVQVQVQVLEPVEASLLPEQERAELVPESARELGPPVRQRELTHLHRMPPPLR